MKLALVLVTSFLLGFMVSSTGGQKPVKPPTTPKPTSCPVTPAPVKALASEEDDTDEDEDGYGYGKYSESKSKSLESFESIESRADGCDDGSPCTDDCFIDKCRFFPTPARCNFDGYKCTNDVCTFDQGVQKYVCQQQGVSVAPCNDGNACTINEACDTKQGCTYQMKVCDGKECGISTCDKDTGACGTPVPVDSLCLDDGDKCTEEFCDSNLACDRRPVACNDNIPCTTDTCDSGTGCVFTPDNNFCEDGDSCTIAECSVPQGGCTFTPVSAPGCPAR